MKFKLAKNSLFAILLRSPWWISMLVVLAFALACTALLPAQYVPLGMVGALPFLVIGLVAAKRQWGQPSPAQVSDTLARVAAMPWRECADALESAYRSQGYDVSTAAGKGADLVLRKGGQTTLVAARRWKAAHHGSEALQALATEQQAQDASHAIYISIVPVTDKARQLALAQGIRLVADAELVRLLR